MRRFVAALALLLLAGPSNADETIEERCDWYATTALGAVGAVTQYTGTLITYGKDGPFGPGEKNSWESFTSPCGFSGPRWSTDYNEHYNWCLGQSEAAAKAEEAARSAGEEFCGICLQYAPAASKAEASGRAGHCPLSGPDWPSTTEGLFRWCLARNHDNLQALTQRLKSLLSDAKDEINACEASRLRVKLSVPRERSPADKARIPQPTLSDTPCRWCKSKSSVTGATQQGGGAMDRLGDLNNNLGTVSGNAGGAQIGRPATSPTTSSPPSADSVVRAPARSNTDPSVFISKPNPTFNNSNTIR